MRISSSWRGVSLAVCIVLLTAFAVRLEAQEDVLESPNPDLGVLRAMHAALLTSDPLTNNLITRATSPDSDVLGSLDTSKSKALDYLRATIDLLAVYDNMQCGPDRATVKALLDDRLRLYSRLLEIDVEGIGTILAAPKLIKLPATGKEALKLRDDLLAAKNKLDTIALK